MAANPYTTLVTRLAAELATLTQYPDLVVTTQVFRPALLPAMTGNYMIVVAPGARPWEERQTAVREIQYLLRLDLFLLVRNYDPVASLFGDSAPDLGLFQMIEDVKILCRQSSLSGLLDKTYTEPGGDLAHGGAGGVDFEEVATAGFDSGEYPFIHRARIPYLARMQPFCHAKAVL